MNSTSAMVSDLMFQNKLLRDRVEAYESGEKYKSLKKKYQQQIARKDREIKRLKKELADEKALVLKIRNQWMEVNEDVLEEKEAALAKADKRIEAAEKKAEQAKQKEKEAVLAKREMAKELCDMKIALQEAMEQIKALTIKQHKDHTNSSKPSSQDPNHRPIPNSRVKSGKRPGAQKGHEHHERKKQDPDEVIDIPTPEEYLDASSYKPTGNTIRKQLIEVSVVTTVTEYRAQEYRNILTGQRVHAGFPYRLKDDVTYGGSVKALAYLLKDELYVSIDKIKNFVREISDGKIDLAAGTICNLSKEFSQKTEKERHEIFLKLLEAPYINADFTFGREKGKQSTALICTYGDVALYQAKPKKGYEGIKGSPLEIYDGTVVCDHEAALIAQGSRHQECMAHIERYCVSSVQNEPDKKWSGEMIKWIHEAIHYRNNVYYKEIKEDRRHAEILIDKFHKILDQAKEEYDYDPPYDYYRDGYNLYSRMSKEPDDYLLLLKDPTIPPTNNAAERCARKYKRKMYQVMTFRSDTGGEYFCNGLSVTQTMKAQKKNLFQSVRECFDRDRSKGDV